MPKLTKDPITGAELTGEAAKIQDSVQVSDNFCVMNLHAGIKNSKVIHKNERFEVLQCDYGVQKHFRSYWSIAGAFGIVERDDGRLVLLRQKRPFMEDSKLELPGGGMNKGENVELALKREILEETGYETISLRHMFSSPPIPGMLLHNQHFYQVRVGNTPVEKPSNPDFDNSRVVLMDMEKAMEALRQGSFVAGFCMTALLYYAQFVRGK